MVQVCVNADGGTQFLVEFGVQGVSKKHMLRCFPAENLDGALARAQEFLAGRTVGGVPWQVVKVSRVDVRVVFSS